MVILSELDPDRAVSAQLAAVVAEKVRLILGEPYRLTVSQETGAASRIVEHRCAASIGVALFNARSASHEEVLRLADAAMYQAKASGRNRVCFADS